MRISSSIICWNEAQTIDLALKSLVGFADEIIIVDTGSFDGTQKIAQETMANLNLSGQIKQARVTKLVDARLKSFYLCNGDWILMQDANVVLSDALKQEMLKRMGDLFVGVVKSLNLMGDYNHFFKNMPFMAGHKIFVNRESVKWNKSVDRPKFIGKRVKHENWAVNLSRVRPSWRSFYRGEPFDSRYFKNGDKAYCLKTNYMARWQAMNKYHSLVDFLAEEEGKSLEDVKRIAPEWYLKQLQLEATPLTEEYRQRLPEIIVEELKNPRYKLIKIGNKIVGRQPRL